jgi:ribose transport system ATP-binding protein
MQNSVLEMKNICKTFGSVQVLKQVDFCLKHGEIHALVGGNGAGKSTLMKIMTGVYSLDSGEVLLEGNPISIRNSRDAKEYGIAMIFQELSLVQSMTITENIFLGEEQTNGVFCNKKSMRKRAIEVLSMLDLDLDPDTKVQDLSVGVSQMVEIAKALSKDAKILVFDEPTASLSDSETKRLFEIMHSLKSKGVSMVYISHRMQEIIEIADSITILRDGSLIDTCLINQTSMDQIISKLVGGESEQKKFEWEPREYDEKGPDLLSVENLDINQDIKNISFSLKKGEILGLAGLMGSGRTEIVETLFGLRKSLRGRITLEGNPIQVKSPNDATKHGFALVPEDRRKQGLILHHSVKENAILPIIDKLRKKRMKFFIDEKNADIAVNKNINDLNIVTDGIHKTVSLLSGGNQQKIVIAKWLNTDPKVLMLDEPTAGVDIGAKTEIIQIIRSYADAGKSVILISSELAELMAVCDRIITLFDGRITGELSRREIMEEEELQHAIQKS